VIERIQCDLGYSSSGRKPARESGTTPVSPARRRGARARQRYGTQEKEILAVQDSVDFS
jgi:hypothetical protein